MYAIASDGLVHRRFITDYEEPEQSHFTVCSQFEQQLLEAGDNHATCLVCVRYEPVYERLPRGIRY
jgi:hypothetical protein